MADARSRKVKNLTNQIKKNHEKTQIAMQYIAAAISLPNPNIPIEEQTVDIEFVHNEVRKAFIENAQNNQAVLAKTVNASHEPDLYKLTLMYTLQILRINDSLGPDIIKILEESLSDEA